MLRERERDGQLLLLGEISSLCGARNFGVGLACLCKRPVRREGKAEDKGLHGGNEEAQAAGSWGGLGCRHLGDRSMQGKER